MSRQNRTNFTTPRGYAHFPAVVEPDQYDERATPQFKCDLRMDASSPEAQQLMAQADEEVERGYQKAVEQAKTKAAAKKIQRLCPYYMEEDDEGDETGNVIFRIRSNAVFEDKKGNQRERRIALFDSTGQPMELDDGMGHNSVVRVGGFFNTVVGTAQGSGASMKLQAVKVLKLEQPGGNTAERFGFDQDESDLDEEDFDGDMEDENEEEPEDF